MLYLMQGMPACAQLRIIVWKASTSRSRSGLWASMMPGLASRSIWLDGSSTGSTMSSDSLRRSAMSFTRLSSSTVG
jgi:hypothetical protein